MRVELAELRSDICSTRVGHANTQRTAECTVNRCGRLFDAQICVACNEWMTQDCGRHS